MGGGRSDRYFLMERVEVDHSFLMEWAGGRSDCSFLMEWVEVVSIILDGVGGL